MTATREAFQTIHDQLTRHYLVGIEDQLKLILTAYLVRGHVLIDGPPGTGKTLAAKVLSQLLSKSFKRIQFTSDMLPADILGSHIYSPQSQKFEFIKGPLFADFVLADEINRTPPRTQSALLEAMEERQVTSEGSVFTLSPYFFVIATQNPQDHEGTFPLPEAQLDRFVMKIRLDHASPENEVLILKKTLNGELPPAFEKIEAVPLDRQQVEIDLQQVKMDDSVQRYTTFLIAETRKHPMIQSGASVRATLALAKCARVWALLSGRDFVVPDDIKELAVPVLRHRIKLTAEAQIDGVSDAAVVEDILSRVKIQA